MARSLSLALMILATVGGALAQGSIDREQVRQTIDAFYLSFNTHDFEHAGEYTAEDWNHINPSGGWTRGREAVLRELKEVHSGFLKGVSDTVDDISVRFASSEVAIATVTSHMGTYHSPDGARHEHERHIRTFVVVKREKRWLIMQDQNTVIGN